MYFKQTWNNGDVITSAKMNHIEDGIKSVDNSVPTFALVNSSGLMTFSNGMTTLFTVQLPLYNGGVS